MQSKIIILLISVQVLHLLPPPPSPFFFLLCVFRISEMLEYCKMGEELCKLIGAIKIIVLLIPAQYFFTPLPMSASLFLLFCLDWNKHKQKLGEELRKLTDTIQHHLIYAQILLTPSPSPLFPFLFSFLFGFSQ
jgi:hypothetical protein